MSNHESVGVTVPATSANLGPGFDSFGVALSATLRAYVLPRAEVRVVARGQGGAEVSHDDDNLVWRAFTAYCEHFGVAVPDVTLVVDNDIPLERGMGSSSAAAVAGITLARALTKAGGTNQDMVDLAAGFDGHPDNVAPAVLGGLVVCLDGKAHRLEPAARLRPVVCVPESRQNTHEARGVLPSSIPLGDAAANGARAAMVLAGLAGAMAWRPEAMTDVLHEPARLDMMVPSGRLIGALREAGVGACLSGAGPSVLAVLPAHDAALLDRVRELIGPGWYVLPLGWNLQGTRSDSLRVPAGARAVGRPTSVNAEFAVLYAQYADRLLRFCRYRLRDPAVAEDVAQEAWARALGALPQLRDSSRFYPWLTIIAQRLTIDHYRVKRRTVSAGLDPSSEASRLMAESEAEQYEGEGSLPWPGEQDDVQTGLSGAEVAVAQEALRQPPPDPADFGVILERTAS